MHQKGFTVAEVVVTLFVAGLLLLAGHQVYITVLNASAEAQQLAEADNISYGFLREYEASTTASCSEQTHTDIALPDNKLPGSPRASVTITCPYGVGKTLSKITATVWYGEPEQEVQHAIFAR